MKPSVSIIMCTRNRAGFLRRSVESAAAQSYEDWELIVADDGSTDRTAELVARFAAEDSRIVSLRNQTAKMTIAQASNWALRSARGEYVAILDDDDAWRMPSKLDLQIAFMERGATACRVRWRDRVSGRAR